MLPKRCLGSRVRTPREQRLPPDGSSTLLSASSDSTNLSQAHHPLTQVPHTLITVTTLTLPVAGLRISCDKTLTKKTRESLPQNPWERFPCQETETQKQQPPFLLLGVSAREAQRRTVTLGPHHGEPIAKLR